LGFKQLTSFVRQLTLVRAYHERSEDFMPNFIRDVEEIRERAIRNIEEGAVTEAYELEPDKVVNILNEALATEIVCVLRYLHHYFMATGVHAKAVSAEFKEHADAEREHADEIAERIQQLGGKPDFNPRTLMERSAAQYVEGETLGDMIREDLIAERIVIDVYSQMIRYFGEKDPTTRILLEHILSEEEEHASDLSDLLYIVEPSSGETEGEDPGVRPLQIHRGEQQRASRLSRENSGRGGRANTAAQRTQSRNEGSDHDEDEDLGRFVGSIDRENTEPRPMAQTIADREGVTRGGQRGAQQQRGRTQGISNRQDTEQLPARGTARAGATASGGRGTGAQAPAQKGGASSRGGSEVSRRGEANRMQGEMRPSRATGSGRQDARSAKPEHEPGTTGRRRRADEAAASIDRGEEGGMGGGTRAVRITNKQRKNRAA
jgi:bacterioferritin